MDVYYTGTGIELVRFSSGSVGFSDLWSLPVYFMYASVSASGGCFMFGLQGTGDWKFNKLYIPYRYT
jgi:hypothetical protein